MFVPGTNYGQFRDPFRVPVFHAIEASTTPNRDNYLPTQSDAFDATWVPRYDVSIHLLETASGCLFYQFCNNMTILSQSISLHASNHT